MASDWNASHTNGDLGKPLGLTGAVAATRYVGGHATAAPTTGTFLAGDFVVTLTGKVFVCTEAGSPGVWVQASGSGGTPANTLSTTNAAGTAATFLRTDDQLALFDATVPGAVGTAAAGSTALAARRDHIHPTGAGTPSTQAFGDAAATGTGPAAAMTDHKHAMPAAPTTIVNDTAWAAKGNLIVATANDTAAVLTAPTTRGQRLSADAAGNVAWAPMIAGPSGVRVWEEFLFSSNLVVATNPSTPVNGVSIILSGTAATASVLTTLDVNHPGVYQFGTGSTSIGNARCQMQTGAFLFGGGRTRFGAWVRIPVLGTSAQRFEVIAGFADGVARATSADGCFFNYIDSVNSGTWNVTTISNSVATATDQVTVGSAVVATSWYCLEIEVNADASSVDYILNGSTVATHVANIPSGAGRTTGLQLGINKTVGATTSLLDVDAYYIEADFTTAR